MSDESPIPAALPVVIPSPVGPAISYSAIRATTSRAQTLLDQLDSKVKKNLRNQMADAGQVGARMEQKVLSRLADQLNPAEQLYQDTSDLIHNQLAASIAPAVVALDDLKQDGAIVKGESLGESSAGVGTLPAAPSRQAEVILPPQLASVRAGALARQLARSSGAVAGGPLVSPFVQPCANPPDAAINAAIAAMVAYSTAHPNPPLPVAYDYWLDPNCCLFTIGEGQAGDPRKLCSTHLGIVTMTAEDKPNVDALIVNALQQNGVPAAKADCTAQCAPIGGVDCTKNPLDPSCPPDCKTHPEDPRCPPTTTDCPTPCSPPCIEVNVPPCPPCPPLEIPPCVQIDLCDWDKFCQKLKDCLIKAKEDCALDNDVAYSFKDCDGSFGDAIDFWYGDQLADVATPDSFQELAASASAKVGNFGDADFAPADPFV